MHRCRLHRAWGSALALLMCIAGGTASSTAAGEPQFATGMELARLVHERPDGENSTTLGRMILQERDGRPRSRDMATFTRDLDDGGTETLIRFHSPADVENTGLLVHDHPDGERDQWLYLPALDRVRRIASDRQGGRFVGSDLFFEDLGDRLPELDEHSLMGDDTYEGAPVTVLGSTPTEPRNSVYSKRVSWIHLETLIPLRIDFYQRGGDEPMKRWTVQRIERIDGYWTVMESTVEDLDSGHTTRLVVDDIVYDRELPAELFSTRGLSDPGIDRRLTP
jgi:hypothetical protein